MFLDSLFLKVGFYRMLTLKIVLPTSIEPGLPVPADLTLILTVCVEFGKVGSNGLPVGVKYAGCGKVMRVG